MTEAKSRVGKEKILQVAERLFTERGYQAVSVRSIADACGVTNAALYYHFEDKASLFAEVIRRHTERISQHLRRAGDGQRSSQEKVKAMAKEYLRLVSHRRSIMHLIRHQAKNMEGAELKSQFTDMAGEVLAPLDEVLENAVTMDEVHPFPEGFSGAAILIGMIHGINGYRRITEQGMIQEEDINQVVDYFWHGISTSS